MAATSASAPARPGEQLTAFSEKDLFQLFCLRDIFPITCVRLIGKRAARRPNARIERSLLLRALHVGHRQFSRIEACLGEVGIEFAHFSRLRGEGGVRRPGIFGLDLNHGV